MKGSAEAEGGSPSLPALFLVSGAALGLEIALTRYFAVAKWSEYGYWVISIVLAGFAFSGVALALARGWFLRHAGMLFAVLPPLLIVTAAAGYWLTAVNPFNPLQLQNEVTLWPQLGNIALYYAALLPFYCLTGCFIGLCFLAAPGHAGLIYGVDLTGAGAGAVLTIALMNFFAPFHLVACLLVVLAAACAFVRPRVPVLVAGLLALAAGEGALLGADPARVNDFKAIYAPMHVPDSRVLAEAPRSSGLYDILDDFTERVDTDVSNNAGAMGVPGPARAYGVYRDGNRIAALPRAGEKASYASATLAALPYALLADGKAPLSVLLAGPSGGFRILEAHALGAKSIVASEPEPVLSRAIARGWGQVPALALPAGATLTGAPPIALVRPPARFDLVDIAGDFADAAEANASSLTTEALAAYLGAVRPAGLVSIPVSIREFPAYATRMLATVRAALVKTGAVDPARQVLVYRSAWNVRILASPAPFTAAQIKAARAWCDDRSFDVSYYPGIDVLAARANIYNDLPAVSFEKAEVESGGGPHDAVADEAADLFAGRVPPSAASFNLSPITLDRPALNAVLRLSGLATILRRLELLPQGEVGPLVNVAVLAQAVVIALAVLGVPLLAGARLRAPGVKLGLVAGYFAALGLGFLLIEIAAIEAASLLLSDRSLAFALVLTGMLIFSGLGALLAPRFAPGLGVAISCAMVAAWCVLMLVILPGALVSALTLPVAVRGVLVLVALAPVSLALGMPFPLGLGRLTGSAALPWAWALNGAFSVVATPLANLIALEQGHARLLQLAVVLYAGAFLSFPRQPASA